MYIDLVVLIVVLGTVIFVVVEIGFLYVDILFPIGLFSITSHTPKIIIKTTRIIGINIFCRVILMLCLLTLDLWLFPLFFELILRVLFLFNSLLSFLFVIITLSLYYQIHLYQHYQVFQLLQNRVVVGDTLFWIDISCCF